MKEEVRRKLPRTGSGLVRVVGARVVLDGVDDTRRMCAWICERAKAEGVQGTVTSSGHTVQAWFEGPPVTVDGMVSWCAQIVEKSEGTVNVTHDRATACAGFEHL